MVFKVLDLFCGVGGSAKGIQAFLMSHNIDFEYFAVDNDVESLVAHEKLNPLSVIYNQDAYTTLLKGFDLIWASPPCATHSQLNMYMKRKNPDMRLWELIKKLQEQETNYILENVQPYYKAPINPTFKIGRHWFWSNMTVVPFEVAKKPKAFSLMGVPDWEKYHEITPDITNYITNRLKRRQLLRNMVHWKTTYGIIEQMIFKTKEVKI